MNKLKLVVGIFVWLAAALIRFVFVLIGLFVVPISLHFFPEKTPRPLNIFGDVAKAPAVLQSKWEKYVWFAWRNPLEGLDPLLKQPIPEYRPNPDELVRGRVGEKRTSASRFMQSGIFWEYWYLRAISIGKYRWFEFRIGWKFVDGNEDFIPTCQFGPRSS